MQNIDKITEALRRDIKKCKSEEDLRITFEVFFRTALPDSEPGQYEVP